MNYRNVLKNYQFSQRTTERLKVIKEKLKAEAIQTEPSWQILATKNEDTFYASSDEVSDESDEDDKDVSLKTPEQFSSTQFYFTQVGNHFDKNHAEEQESKLDIIESIFEELERPNGKLDINQLEKLIDTELADIICELGKKLTILGTYNLCRTMNNMNLEKRIKYAPIFHTHILLPKIIGTGEPSRLLLSAIVECVQKFPDDIQKLIFIPLLNVDLKDTTIVDAMMNSFEPQRHGALLKEYFLNAKELKSWHLHFLHNLISVKVDTAISGKLMELLYRKAHDFAKDKNFGKLVLSFIKANGTFSMEQKHLLCEIADANETLFKKPIQSVLRTIKS